MANSGGQGHAAAGKVTTVIPCHNASATLRQSVRSVRLQAIPSDILIVDDGSDAEEARATSRIARDFDATVICLPGRLGPSSARNVGLDRCRTPYVAFLDADDFWLPGKLCAQLAEMEARQLKFSYMVYANQSGDRLRSLSAPASLSRSELLRNTAIGCSTVMLCTAFVGARRFGAADCEDLAFWALLLGTNERAHLVGAEPAVVRRMGGRSQNRLLAAYRYWRTLRDALNLPPATAAGHFIPYALRAARKHWLPAAPAPSLSRPDAKAGIT